MTDTYVWILYFVIVVVGVVATVLYWVGRYFFNTDDEQASMNVKESTTNEDSD